MQKLLSFFLLLAGMLLTPAFAQDFSGVSYGPEDRQFVDIYIAPSSCPTPVYFDAHGNGGNTNLPSSLTNALIANGISIVAWESLTSINTPTEVQTGWDDAELMFAWVKANADTYNFDTTNFIIGGSSRGSILSWKYGHRADPNIKGLYMYNALPIGVWADSSWWYPPNEVKTTAPPVFFVYRREPGCSTDPVDPDIHDPIFGMNIMDTYEQLGIGDRDTLIHSIIDSASSDRYQYLVDFAISVLEPCSSVNITEETSPEIKVFPNPFTSHIHIEGLPADAQVRLSNQLGQLILQGQASELTDLQALTPGVYYLDVSAHSIRKTVLLRKE